MTINIDKLRQALGAVQPEEVAELLDRLEAAEKERDALRAKIEAMERQEPVAAQHRFRHPQKQCQIGLYGSRALYQTDRRG